MAIRILSVCGPIRRQVSGATNASMSSLWRRPYLSGFSGLSNSHQPTMAVRPVMLITPPWSRMYRCKQPEVKRPFVIVCRLSTKCLGNDSAREGDGAWRANAAAGAVPELTAGWLYHLHRTVPGGRIHPNDARARTGTGPITLFRV